MRDGLSVRAAAVTALLLPFAAMDGLAQEAGFDPTLVRLVEATMALPEVVNLAPLRISPDGLEVAFTVVDPRRRPIGGFSGDLPNSAGVQRFVEGGTVVVASTRGDGLRTPFAGRGSSWGAEWSPDGRQITFLSDHGGAAQVWLWDRSGGEPRRLSTRGTMVYFGHETPRWMPAGDQVLVKLLPEGVTPDELFERRRVEEGSASDVTVAVLQSGGAAACRGGETRGIRVMRGDLALIDIGTGELRTLVEAQPFAAYWISPDGKRVAYMRWSDSNGCGSIQPVYDLHVVDVETAIDRLLVRGIEQVFGLGVSWSPDSGTLAFSEAPYPVRFSGAPRGDISIVDAVSGEIRVLTEAVQEPLGSIYDPPLWNETGEQLFVAAGGRLWRIDIAERRARAILDLEDWHVVRTVGRAFEGSAGEGPLLVQARAQGGVGYGFLRVDTDGQWALAHRLDISVPETPFAMDHRQGVLAFTAERADMPPALWVSLADGAPQAVLLSPEARALQGCFGDGRLIHWRHDDGREVSGALFLPPNHELGAPLPPLVVSVYGGLDGSRHVRDFGRIGFDMRLHPLLTARGYAVLYPNAPMEVGAPVDDLARALIPGLVELNERGIVNASEAALMGMSYGGYSTLAVLTRTSMFRAGLVLAGFANLTSFYADRGRGETAGLSWMEEGQGRMGASPWVSRERYIDNSPFFFLDRISTPILIAHGTEDTSTLVSQADGVFASLARLGKPAEYLRYQGEGHAFWGAANTRDFLIRSLSFLERHLPVSARPACLEQAGAEAATP